MAAKAFVLVEVSAGRVLKALREIQSLDEIAEAYAITGQYDIIAMLQAADMAGIGRICLNKIQPVDGVLRTVTCHVVEF